MQDGSHASIHFLGTRRRCAAGQHELSGTNHADVRHIAGDDAGAVLDGAVLCRIRRRRDHYHIELAARGHLDRKCEAATAGDPARTAVVAEHEPSPQQPLHGAADREQLRRRLGNRTTVHLDARDIGRGSTRSVYDLALLRRAARLSCDYDIEERAARNEIGEGERTVAGNGQQNSLVLQHQARTLQAFDVAAERKHAGRGLRSRASHPNAGDGGGDCSRAVLDFALLPRIFRLALDRDCECSACRDRRSKFERAVIQDGEQQIAILERQTRSLQALNCTADREP